MANHGRAKTSLAHAARVLLRALPSVRVQAADDDAAIDELVDLATSMRREAAEAS